MKALKVNLDSRNRIPLTRILEGCEAKTFRIYWESDRIVLEPLAEIPERELWLYKNKDALASLERGLDDSAKGRTRKLNLKDLPEVDGD